ILRQYRSVPVPVRRRQSGPQIERVTVRQDVVGELVIALTGGRKDKGVPTTGVCNRVGATGEVQGVTSAAAQQHVVASRCGRRYLTLADCHVGRISRDGDIAR